MAKHNKKRNVGLIHEQLVRFASEKIVEGKKQLAETVLSVLKKHFDAETELCKEFRLFNALVHTRVSSEDTARRIIIESKLACKNHDANKLRVEKSALIRSINHDLNDCGFYDKRIYEYKIFATVQALLNDWRGANRLAPNEIVKYENVLEEWLTRPRDESALHKKDNADPLTLKIMTEKFNKKYASCLNTDQAYLLEHALTGNNKKATSKINEIKQRAEVALSRFYVACNNSVLNEKRELIEAKIYALEVNSDDATIKKALMLPRLVEELEGDDE